MKKKKVAITALILLAVGVTFLLGLVTGVNYKVNKRANKKYISFFEVKKMIGKETTKEEKEALKMFIVPYENCLREEVTIIERESLTDIQNEVLDMAKDNSRVKFKIDDLKSAENNHELIRKVKKCQKITYKHMTKTDKRLFRAALSKLKINNIIEIFHGIK